MTTFKVDFKKRTVEKIGRLARSAGLERGALIERAIDRLDAQQQAFEKLDAMRGKVKFDFKALRQMGIHGRS